jgi:predicted phage terminase large subunit-like protein
MAKGEQLLVSARDVYYLSEESWQPLPHQVPPPDDDSWNTWMLLGGRGSGKTMAGTHYVLDHLRRYGSRARVGIGAPTYGDVRDVCAEGVTGLITLAPSEFVYNRSTSNAYHRDGGFVKFLGAEEPGRWNGPQWSLLWADELALWKEETWHQAQFGLRLGEHPKAIVTTTPKARQFVRDLSMQEGTVAVHATTFDNTNLSDSVLKRLDFQYGGSNLGRQELLAEWIDDIEGALWQRSWIDDMRVTVAPPMQRIVVAIDPAASAHVTSDETGLAVAGLGEDGHIYVLASDGVRFTPEGWAKRVIELFDEFEADLIVGETNNGGDMVGSTLENALRSDSRYSIPYQSIHASRGKTTRAEPVAVLYSHGYVHHVGSFDVSEDQMCSFPVANEHDDRVDALVYAITELTQRGVPEIRFLDINS